MARISKRRTSSIGHSNELGHAKASSQPKQSASLKTVDKALRVLDFLAVFGGQVGVRELAKTLGVNKSSVHRLLATLESHGYVAQDPNTGKYQMGLRVFEIGEVVLSQTNLRAAARPHLENLAETTGEVVHLAVENRGQCLYVDKLTGWQAISTGSALGWRRPLYCTGVGKVLLAHLPRPHVDEIIASTVMTPYTPYTITDANALIAELKTICDSGVAYDREEMEMGLWCVAVPIWGTDGNAVAAISVAGPIARFGSERLPALVQQVRAVGESISRDFVSRLDKGS